MTPEELVELVRAHVRRAGRWLRISEHDAEDLVQDTCIVALRTAERFDETLGCKLSTFLGRRIDGYILDWLRSKTGPKTWRFALVPLLDCDPAPRHVDTEGFVEECRGVMRGMAKSQRDAEILTACFFGGETQEQVGVRYGLGDAMVCRIVEPCKRAFERMAHGRCA